MPDANLELEKKRSDEKRLVSEMIALYCRRQHHTPRGQLCPECQELHDYARIRIDRCPLMESKTFCSACRVHCYKCGKRSASSCAGRVRGCCPSTRSSPSSTSL